MLRKGVKKANNSLIKQGQVLFLVKEGNDDGDSLVGHLFFSLSNEAIDSNTCTEDNDEVTQKNQENGVFKKAGIMGFHGGE